MDFIKHTDPEEKIVSINLDKKTVTYHIRKEYHDFLDPEEWVRAYYVLKLVRENDFNPKNIEAENEWEFTIGRGQKKARSDIVVYKNGSPHIILELKPPLEFEKQKYDAVRGQLYGIAYNVAKENLNWLVYATIIAEKDVLEEILVIDYPNFPDYKKWKTAQEPSYSQIPDKEGKFSKLLIKGKDRLIPLTHEHVIKIKQKLHNRLWRGGARADNKIFFNLLKLVITKIYDEKETENGKPYGFQLYYNEGLVDYEKVNTQTQEMYKRTLTDRRYLDLKEEKLKKLSQIEAGTEVIELSPPEIAFIVSEFQRYSLQTTYDVLSIFFETIIREEFKQTTGLYFTPINLVRFMIYGLELDNLGIETLKTAKNRLPYIIDPACGSGTFLIEAMKLVTKVVLENKSEISVTESIEEFIRANFDEEGKRHLWAQEFLYGMDNHPHLALTTKVNMVMNGDGHVHVYADDSLDDFQEYDDLMRITLENQLYKGKLNEQFDVVVSNPPFSMEIDIATMEKYREHFPILGNKGSEMLFIERWYQLLRSKGRMAVVLPESIFDTTENMDVRLFLFKYFWVKAIISLPSGMKQGAFAPYTGTTTSLLFAQKKSEVEVEQWDKLWKKYEFEFMALKKKVEACFGKISRRYGRESQKTIEEFSENNKAELVKILGNFLREKFDESDKSLDNESLIRKYWVDVSLISKDWWVFGKVVEDVEKDYPEWKTRTFVTHTDKIGYKRTKIRHYRTENKLFRVDKQDRIKIDLDSPKTILENLRKVVRWE